MGDMRTLIAVICGLVVTGLLIFFGDAVIAAATGTRVVAGYPGASHTATLAALIWSASPLVAGAAVAVRIRPTREALAGFIVGELFFGAGLLHQFWHAQRWFNFLGLLLVIPAAMLGSRIAFRGKARLLSEY